MSPLKISILLHYYCIGEDYRDGDFSAPAVQQALDDFCEEKMLQPMVNDHRHGPNDTRHYEIAERGEVFVKALQELPLPVPAPAWRMP